MNAHQHEEDRHQDRLQRRNQILDGKAMLAVVPPVPKVAVVQDDAGGKGPDNGRQANQVGKPRQRHDEEKGDEHLGLDDVEVAHQANGVVEEDGPDQKGQYDKQRGEQNRHQHVGELHAAGYDNAGNNGQHDQTEHVIQHRRAEDDARFARLTLVKIGQHARADADTGGAERGGNEQVDGQRQLRH